MSDFVVIIGDSYLDPGNLNALMPEAFSFSPYNDGRPSDGIGLAEATADGLGVRVNEKKLDRDSFFARLEILNPFVQPNLKAVTYATAGATLGELGTATATVAGQSVDLSPLSIGNEPQINRYLEDLQLARTTQKKPFRVDEVTYVINGGNNEILELLANEIFISAVLDPEDYSEVGIIGQTVQEIVDTLTAQINQIDSEDGLISHVALLGVFPVGEAPLVNQIANDIADNLGLPDLAPERVGLNAALTDTFSGIAQLANNSLDEVIDQLNGDTNREGEFAFVDPFPIFDTLVNSDLFEETEVSYLQYLTEDLQDDLNNGVTPPSADKFLFVDEVHTGGRANEIIGEMISEQLPEIFNV